MTIPIRQGLLILLVLWAGKPLLAQTGLRQADSTLNYLYQKPIQNKKAAIALCEKLIAFYRKNDLTCRQIKVLAFEADLLGSLSEYEASQKTILKAERLQDHSNCGDQYRVYINYAISGLKINLGDYKQSDSILLYSIKLYRKGLPDKNTLVKLLLNLGMDNWELEKITPYLDTAYQLAVELNNDYLKQRALINLGATYAMHGKMERARHYLKKALPVARKRGDYKHLGALYNNLAGLSDKEKDVLMYIDSAQYYAQKGNDLYNLETFTENKALFYRRNGHFKEAYANLFEAMKLRDSLFNIQKYEAIADLEKKYEAGKKSNEIQALKLKNLDSEVAKLKLKRNQDTLLVGSILLMLAAGFFGYNFISIRKNRNKLAEKNQQISEEQQRSDSLLLNILPTEIARELKEKGKADAKFFEVATILFTDLVEFTRTASALDTEELVEELNYCFRGFDQIMDKYGIEKIKTIGDAYMAVGGVPSPSPHSLKNTVLAALEMQEFIMAHRKSQDEAGKTSFEMRAGIHTGPVVAGIVGQKKFQYDIWGDAVNTASRLESTGSAGQVNISQTTYEGIKDDPMFLFESRGKILAKGKGEISMYFVRLAI